MKRWVFRVVLFLLISFPNFSKANDYAWDQIERERRAVENFVKYEEIQRKRAKERYDSQLSSENSSTESGGVESVIVFFVVVVGFVIIKLSTSKPPPDPNVPWTPFHEGQKPIIPPLMDHYRSSAEVLPSVFKATKPAATPLSPQQSSNLLIGLAIVLLISLLALLVSKGHALLAFSILSLIGSLIYAHFALRGSDGSISGKNLQNWLILAILPTFLLMAAGILFAVYKK